MDLVSSIDWLKVFNIAIKAIGREIPKKPIEYEDKFYACPVCNNILLHKWIKYPVKLMPKTEGLPYCMSCGQKLDWSGREGVI